LIAIEGLEFDYGDEDGFYLSVPSLRFKSGEHTAIVGPSGCGKTTLLSLIAGILQPTRGSIENQSVPLSELGDRERRRFRIQQIGLVFQSFELLDYLDVRDNVLLPYRIHPDLSLSESVRKRAVGLVEAVGLEGSIGRAVTELSQGERQRVAVARAMIAQPPLLLADEPTGNLDPNNKLRIIDLLLATSRESESTIITVTHDHSLLDRFDRVVEFEAIAA
jgi:putative ABC transport system ATP-binding protein